MVPEQRLFSPAMALSPYTRPYGMPNLWIGESEFPQTLTLITKKTVDANKIAIIFDTNLENDSVRNMPECLVKDYDLTIYCKNNVITKNVHDNWKRYDAFDINATQIEKIELTIKSSWGAQAGVFGINLF